MMKSGAAKTAAAVLSAMVVVTAVATLYPDRNEQFMPKPRSLAVDYSRMFPLTDGTRFAVACPKSEETAAGISFYVLYYPHLRLPMRCGVRQKTRRKRIR